MSDTNVIGQGAEFDPDAVPLGQAPEEVKEPIADEVVEGTETPAELPADAEQSAEQPLAPSEEDTGQPAVDSELLQKEVIRATAGLRNEIVDLRTKLATATGNDRKITQDQIVTAQENLNELEGVNPGDVELVEKVLKSKGYLTKDEVTKMTYETVQSQVLNSFLDKYPEYKPENDPDNINWTSLTKEYGLYAQPRDPQRIAELLERSHQAIKGAVVSDRSLPAKKRAMQIASAGAGGTQRSSSGGKTLTPDQRRVYEDGGWSEEEIKQIEKGLSDN